MRLTISGMQNHPFFKSIVCPPDSVVLSFKGYLTQLVVDDYLATMEERLSQGDVALQLKKRLMNVAIEAVQNVYHHQEALSAETSDSDGFDLDSLVCLTSNLDGCYKLTTLNVVFKSRISELDEKIKWVNGFDAESLRKAHIELLGKTEFSEKGGAGLGFLDLARKSGKPIEYRFVDINHLYSYFILTLTIC